MGTGDWIPGIYFTDGSGGKKGSDPRLRRCGWGVVRLNLDDPGNPSLACGAFGPLPGPLQTVPRSEIFAAIQVLDLVHGAVIIYSDCEYFVSRAGALGQRARMRAGKNGDLWARWWDLVDERDGAVIVRKVKAHSEHRALVSGAIALELYMGNAYADYMAGKGAEMGELDSNIILKVEEKGRN